MMKEILMTTEEAINIYDEYLEEDHSTIKIFNRVPYVVCDWRDLEDNIFIGSLEDELNSIITTPEDTKITIKKQEK